MATIESERPRTESAVSRNVSSPSLSQDETKLSFKTTEFWAMVVLVAAILISAAVIDADGGTDQFIARQAWLLVAILGAGYFVSRGLAKCGSYEPDADYNPVQVTGERESGRPGQEAR